MKTLSKICLLFFISIVVSYFYIGVTTVPSEGDSLNYHIPVANAYLDGTIFTPEKIQGVPFLKFSPGASEGILALFYLFHLPANLFNVFGVVVLFFSMFYLGKRFGMGTELSNIFATSFATINGIVRWLDTQKIDIFMAAFYAIALGLLVKPQKSVKYFFLLGIFSGLVVGSKYSGLFFTAILFLTFSRRIISNLSLTRFIGFIVPFALFGLSWYIRNYIATGNPLYPQGFLIFKDYGFTILEQQVWRVVLSSWFGFLGTFNAFISEYMIWVLTFPVLIFFILKNIKKIFIKENQVLLMLLIIGMFNFAIYLFLPSDNINNIMVSVIRYSYPVFIPFLLATFLLAKRFQLEANLSIISVTNMFFVGFPIVYNPKLVFFAVPIGLLLFSKEFRKNKDRK